MLCIRTASEDLKTLFAHLHQTSEVVGTLYKPRRGYEKGRAERR